MCPGLIVQLSALLSCRPGQCMRCTCCTSMPRDQMSVVMSTRVVPERNSFMMASRSFWGMSPWMLLTVKLAARIFSVSQSVCSSNGRACQHVRVAVADTGCSAWSTALEHYTTGKLQTFGGLKGRPEKSKTGTLAGCRQLRRQQKAQPKAPIHHAY